MLQPQLGAHRGVELSGVLEHSEPRPAHRLPPALAVHPAPRNDMGPGGQHSMKSRVEKERPFEHPVVGRLGEAPANLIGDAAFDGMAVQAPRTVGAEAVLRCQTEHEVDQGPMQERVPTFSPQVEAERRSLLADPIADVIPFCLVARPPDP